MRAMAHPDPQALAALQGQLGESVVLTDADALEQYRHDWSRDPNAGVPAAVVRARHADDVQAAVRWAAEHRVPVVPRGAGSGLSGVGGGPLGIRGHQTSPVFSAGLGNSSPISQPSGNFSSWDWIFLNSFGVTSMMIDE